MFIATLGGHGSSYTPPTGTQNTEGLRRADVRLRRRNSGRPSMTIWIRARPWYHQAVSRALRYLRDSGSHLLVPRNPSSSLPIPSRGHLGLPALFSASSSSTDPVDNPTTAARSAAEADPTTFDAPAPGEPASAGGAEGVAKPGVDPDELHALVVEHSDAIFRLALSVVRDRSLAEDVAQETLVKAWLALPSFRGDSSLRSWVLRIAHNTAVSTLRRRRAVVLDPHDMPEQQSRVERSVESRVQTSVVMDQFVAALDQLDELSRSIVVLRELEGLAYDEIAEVLKVPMPTVKTRLLRARRRLGSVLREWE